MPSATTLRVLANPWLHLDHEGQPAGACPCDPDEHTPERRFVGAKLQAKLLREADLEKRQLARHRITFAFDESAQDVPNTAYYRATVNSGELIAADPATAKLCGFRAESFRDPQAVLAEARAAAFDNFKASYDEAPPFERVAPKAKAAQPAKDGDK